MTKRPTKHTGLLWPSAKFIITPCAFKTLSSWKTEAPLA